MSVSELSEEEKKKFVDEYALAYINSMTLNELRKMVYNDIRLSFSEEEDDTMVELAQDLNVKIPENIDEQG